MTGGKPHRLSRRRSGRLLDGDPAARAGDVRLAALIDALGPGEPGGGSSGEPADGSIGGARRAPAAVLAAFAGQPDRGPGARHASRSGARSGARSRHARSVLTVKTAAVVLVLSGGTVAAAAGDALPGPAQRAAHELFGSWGVPAPTPPAMGQPQSPEPTTAPVLREGATTGGSGSSTAPGTAGADPAPSASGSASTSGPADAGQTTTPGTSDCADHTHGKDRRCEPVETSSSPVAFGVASVIGTVATTPPATPTVHTTHTPPERRRIASEPAE